MPEDKTHAESELFDTPSDEVVTDDASTIAKRNEENNQENEPTREQVRQNSIDRWKERIQKGEKTLEDIPPAQKWIKDAISKKESQPKSQDHADMDSVLDRKFAERDDRKAFDTLKASMEFAKLSDAQKKAVLHEYEELRTEGGMMGKSLDRALKIAGVRLEKDNAMDLKKAQRMPAPDSKPMSDDDIDTPFDTEGNYDISKGTSESRMRFMESERAKGLTGQEAGAKAYQRYRRK